MNNQRHFFALTSLKGIFILIIVFHNTFSITSLFDSIPGISFITLFGGKLGNSMFFILSGYLFAVCYRDRIRDHTISFKDYLLRRLQKLYPLYLITNLTSLIIEIVRYGLSAINLEKIIFTLLLQCGGGLGRTGPYNSPTWFLSALFVCYIAFFVMAFYSKNATQYYCSIVAGIIWGYILISADLNLPFCSAGNGTGFMNFFIGCGLAEIYPLIKKNTHRWLQPTSIIVLAGSGYLLLSYGVEIICGDVSVAFSFLICPLILYLALVDGPCSKLLQLKPLVSLGKISSSIFFWHLVIFFAFCDLFSFITGGANIQEPQYILYAVLMVMWSAISFRWIENRQQQNR